MVHRTGARLLKDGGARKNDHHIDGARGDLPEHEVEGRVPRDGFVDLQEPVAAVRLSKEDQHVHNKQEDEDHARHGRQVGEDVLGVSKHQKKGQHAENGHHDVGEENRHNHTHAKGEELVIDGQSLAFTPIHLLQKPGDIVEAIDPGLAVFLSCDRDVCGVDNGSDKHEHQHGRDGCDEKDLGVGDTMSEGSEGLEDDLHFQSEAHLE